MAPLWTAEKELIDQLTTLWADAHRSAAKQAVRTGADAIASQLETQMDKTIKSIQVADDDRRGFSLTFAAASAWLVLDATSAERKLTKWGAWATPSFRPDVAPMELIGVTRVSHLPDAGGDTMIDFGGRATNQIGPFNWSLEYVERVDRT
jgi:hypothetical protein